MNLLLNEDGSYKTEKSYPCQIFDFPSGLIQAIQGKPDWDLVHTNPETSGHMGSENPYYELRFEGKKVLGWRGLYGFGHGSQASYPRLRFSVMQLIRTVYPVQVYWPSLLPERQVPGNSVIYEGEYYDPDAQKKADLEAAIAWHKMVILQPAITPQQIEDKASLVAHAEDQIEKIKSSINL